jgi:hypothetical protein
VYSGKSLGELTGSLPKYGQTAQTGLFDLSTARFEIWPFDELKLSET